MTGLIFGIEGAEAVAFAAAPTIVFRLRVSRPEEEHGDRAIQSVALRCQILIEAQRRKYTATERAGLRDLFGEPDRWSHTVRPLLWTHAGLTVPAFDNSIAVEIPVACTFDFNVAATKYFHAAGVDDVPLVFQFSGTVFYSCADGNMQIAQIGWDKESRFRLPASVWREMMDLYYPNSSWVRLRRDVFDRLLAYKQQQGLATWEQALDSLLPEEAKKGAA